MEKLAESEKLVLKLQNDLEFVLKDKVGPLLILSLQRGAPGRRVKGVRVLTKNTQAMEFRFFLLKFYNGEKIITGTFPVFSSTSCSTGVLVTPG